MDIEDESRIVKSVVHPAKNKLDCDDIFMADGKLDLVVLKEHFFKEGKLEKEAALRILSQGSNLLRQEDNVISVSSPITSNNSLLFSFYAQPLILFIFFLFFFFLPKVWGDTHGQLYDLFKLFEIGGRPEDTNYLFLGDYVDRGYFSCENYLYLLAHKINFPDSFFMLRGNHECRHLTACFTLKEECRLIFYFFYDIIMLFRILIDL